MEGKKALVIEDNEDIRESTAEVLMLAGFETLTAANGKVGVELAIKNIPDIILCDIMMPELDGYGVLYLLQKNPQTAHIPFIFMTAKAERADMRKGMEMGADDYLTKPFDDMELFNAIESRLKKQAKPQGYKSQGKSLTNLLEELIKKGKQRHFASKQIIYVEQDEPDFLYYIKKGQIKLYKRAADGRELSANLYHDHDFFGYVCISQGGTYNENAATLTDTDLILIAKADFLDALATHSEIAQCFIQKLSSSVQDKDDQMLKLAYFSVRKRVAEAMVRICEKFGDPQSDEAVIRVSRDDIAALVGTASETVSRMLADFKAENLIEKNGNAIKVLSIEKLRKIKQ
ncbi:MAG: response regulator [Pedobacter sp.]|nr:MAG: response regulator [Pedobacter sp.]